MPASCAYPGSYGALSVQALTVRTPIPGPAVEQLRGHGWPVKGVIPDTDVRSGTGPLPAG